MAEAKLSQFKSRLAGGGARPNLFEVELTTIPSGIGASWDSDVFSVLCKSAALPASNVAPIDVPFRGRIFKVAGDRTFDTWTITVINDTDFRLRTAFEKWMQGISQYGDGSGFTNPGDYMTDAVVRQLTRKNTNYGGPVDDGLDTLKEYKFYDIFPTNISQIDLSFDTSDTIEEFTVEFQVQHWAPL
jgi:hypothetical protein